MTEQVDVRSATGPIHVGVSSDVPVSVRIAGAPLSVRVLGTPGPPGTPGAPGAPGPAGSLEEGFTVDGGNF